MYVKEENHSEAVCFSPCFFRQLGLNITDCTSSSIMNSCILCFLIDSAYQMKGWTLPPDIPLAALSASKFDDLKIPAEDQVAAKNIHIKLLADLARQSFNSFYYVVPDSGHANQFERPDVVIDSIRRVVEAVRTQTKLTSPNQWNKGRLDKGTLAEK